MDKSGQLRVQDARAIWRLADECRELGDDRAAWGAHCVAELARLVDADMGVVGEMAGCHSLALRDLGASYWCQLDLPAPDRLHSMIDRFRDDPGLSLAMLEYHRLNRPADGHCLSRRDFIGDRDWARSDDVRIIHDFYGTDSTMWCFRQMAAAKPGESSGIVMIRAKGRRDFGGRARAIIREANASLAPLMGGALSRSREPSPADPPPRVRRVLACLLQGDGDKQVAARLRIGTHTVNEYTKLIYRHFGVRGRAELLARWIRCGWGGRFAWDSGQPALPGEVIHSMP